MLNCTITHFAWRIQSEKENRILFDWWQSGTFTSGPVISGYAKSIMPDTIYAFGLTRMARDAIQRSRYSVFNKIV